MEKQSLLSTLISYLPARAAARLTRPDPFTSYDETFPAAVLFADISGFTSLAERLAEQGPAGAEKLSDLLDGWFGRLIDLILAHGGDVVKFAGDAMLALWPAEGGEAQLTADDGDVPQYSALRLNEKTDSRHKGKMYSEDAASAARSALADATLRTTRCALDINEELSRLEPAPGTRLSLKLAVAAGNIRMAQLGGVEGRAELLVAGAPLRQAGNAESQARPGEICVASTAWPLIEELAEGKKLKSGDVRLQCLRSSPKPRPLEIPRLSEQIAPSLRPFIQEAVRSRLDAGQGSWLAELRPLTVLFIHLPEINEDTPHERAHDLICTVQEILVRHEGSLNKLSVDEKGIALLVAFGLPPLAHGDDPVRGVQAALAIRKALDVRGWQCAIGVTSGRVYCGTVGNEKRREYTILGDAVNLSARLMQAAHDEISSEHPSPDAGILCDEATWRHTQLRLGEEGMSARAPLKLKGKSSPVPVYVPKAVTSSAIAAVVRLRHSETSEARIGAATRMVGRSIELEVLRGKLRALLAGESSTLVVEGTAGIGKSVLLQEFVALARQLDITGLVGAGDPIEVASAYRVWRPIISRILGSVEDTHGRLREQRLEGVLQLVAQLDPELVTLAPLLNAIFPLDIPETERTASLEGEARAENTRRLFAGLLKAFCQRHPTLLVLEDTQWMDSASRALLRLVAHELQPVVLVLAHRSTAQISPELDVIFSAPKVQRLRLEPLPPEEALALVCKRLGVSKLPPPVASILREKAEGHPFFSEELAYALRNAGVIQVEEGTCRLCVPETELRRVSLPDTLHGAITNRIDHLTPHEQLTLKVASVIGRLFTYGSVAAVHPLEDDRAHLRAQLDCLASLDLTPLVSLSSELQYIFKHAITQEVAYGLMSFAQRQMLHRRVAEWLEQSDGGVLVERYPRLAHHWRRALNDESPDLGVVEKAFEYLEKAGEHAATQFANQEVVGFLTESINLDDGLGRPTKVLRRARWERLVGQAHYQLGQMLESRRLLEQAIRALDRPFARGVGQFLRLLAQVGLQLRHRAKIARTGLKQGNKRGSALEASRAWSTLFILYYQANDTVSTTYAALRSLNLAESVGLIPETANAYSTLCLITGTIPIHFLARRYGRLALDNAGRLKHPASLAWVLEVLAVYAIGLGEWDMVQLRIEKAIRIAQELGDERRWEETNAVRAWLHYFKGELEESYNLWEAVADSAGRRGDPQPHIWGLCGRVESGLACGRLSVQQAAECLEEARGILPDDQYRAEAIRVYGVLAKLYLRQWRLDDALVATSRCVETSAGLLPTTFYSFEGYSSLVEVYLALYETALKQASTQPSSPEIDDDFQWLNDSQDFSAVTDAPARQSSLDGEVPMTPLELRRAVRRALFALRHFALVFPIARPRRILLQAQLLWLEKKHGRAKRSARRGLRLAVKLGMPREEDLIRRTLEGWNSQ